jgi:T-complex protein 1 subunit alpha
MCVDAIQHVKTVNSLGETRYPVKAVNILKAHGQGSRESQFMSGYALNCTRAAQGMPSYVSDAKIALLDLDLRRFRLAMGIQVVVTDPEKLQAIQDREVDIVKERINKILDAGANVILTTKGMDDVAMKYLIDRGCMGVRRVTKEDMRRIAKCTGGSIILSMSNLEGEEVFDAGSLGRCDMVKEVRVGDNEMTVFEGTKMHRSGSILLRGANEYMLDEMERSMHDALCMVKRVLESGKVVPGGGCVEVALSVFLDNFARQLSSREQMAVAEFAEALLVIPKTLAVNAAQDATELVAKLRASHYLSQTADGKKGLMHTGLDLVQGELRDNLSAGVLEPAMSKVKILQFATEAAITVLRIDDFFKVEKQDDEQ